MTRQFARDSKSFPVYAIAESFGVDRKYAMILRDAVLNFKGEGPEAGIQPGSYWHIWAMTNACEEHGKETVDRFLLALLMFYKYGVQG